MSAVPSTMAGSAYVMVVRSTSPVMTAWVPMPFCRNADVCVTSSSALPRPAPPRKRKTRTVSGSTTISSMLLFGSGKLSMRIGVMSWVLKLAPGSLRAVEDRRTSSRGDQYIDFLAADTNDARNKRGRDDSRRGCRELLYDFNARLGKRCGHDQLLLVSCTCCIDLPRASSARTTSRHI